MTKGTDGVWSVTIGPLAPDIYTYAFTVDGTVALDPSQTATARHLLIWKRARTCSGMWR